MSYGILTTVLFWLSGLSLVQTPGTPASRPGATSQPASERFSDEIRRFVEWDRRNSFPPEPVLFVGSSSIRLWATRESFPRWTVINRGFGGSYLSDVNDRFEQVVRPYRAKLIVLYAGDNDIASGKSPQTLRDNFAAFVAKVRADQPNVPIVFLSIKPSASRWSHWPRMQQANNLIRALCEKGPHLSFVDVGSPLLGEDGTPRPELFLPDKLHLSPAGYDVWTRMLTPVIEQELRTNPPTTRPVK